MSTSRPFPTQLGLAVCLSAGAAPALAQAPTPLRWKFRVGETLRYELRQKNEINVKSGGQETINQSDLTIGMTWKVRSAAARGPAEVELTVDRVAVTIYNGPQTIRFS